MELLRRLGRNRRARKFMMGLINGHPWFWSAIESVPLLRRLANRIVLYPLVNSAPPRPYPFSLWGPPGAPPASPEFVADYTSWTGLVDRKYTGRQLPPDDVARVNSLPKLSDVQELLLRRGPQKSSPRSSALLGFFAQWLTDSFLRTSADIRMTSSNHELDLCQIYGLDDKDTRILRSMKGGKLESQRLSDRPPASGPERMLV